LKKTIKVIFLINFAQVYDKLEFLNLFPFLNNVALVLKISELTPSLPLKPIGNFNLFQSFLQ